MGNALGIAQFGGTAPAAKPWKGLVTVRHPDGQTHIDLVAERLKTTERDHEAHYGKSKR